MLYNIIYIYIYITWYLYHISQPHVAMKCFFEVNMLTEIIKTASAVLMPPVKPIPGDSIPFGWWIYGGFNGGYPNSWMDYHGRSCYIYIYIYGWFGGTPILGHLHIYCDFGLDDIFHLNNLWIFLGGWGLMIPSDLGLILVFGFAKIARSFSHSNLGM